MAQAIYSTEDVSFIIAGDVDVAGLYRCALPQRDLQVSAVSCVCLKNSTLLTRNPQGRSLGKFCCFLLENIARRMPIFPFSQCFNQSGAVYISKKVVSKVQYSNQEEKPLLLVQASCAQLRVLPSSVDADV